MQIENQNSSASVSPQESSAIHIPLDYAPKRSNDEPGTLSDSFGLHSEIVENPADPAKVYSKHEKSA